MTRCCTILSYFCDVYAYSRRVYAACGILDECDFTTNLTAVIACMGNIGPGLGKVGPMGNFSEFSALSKIVLTLDMLIGRLEIFPIIMVFTPETWKKV